MNIYVHDIIWLLLFNTAIHFIAFANFLELKTNPLVIQDTSKTCDTLFLKSGSYILVKNYEYLDDQVKFTKCEQKDEESYFLIYRDELVSINSIVATNVHATKPKINPFKNQYNYASVYGEIIGAAPLFSYNAEYVLRIDKNTGFSFRVGIGFLPDIGLLSSDINSPTIEFPIAGSFIYGNTIAAEFGYGFTLVSGSSSFNDIFRNGISQHAFIGFRLQKLSNKILIRCGYTPVWRGHEILNLFGVGIGTRFNLKKNK